MSDIDKADSSEEKHENRVESNDLNEDLTSKEVTASPTTVLDFPLENTTEEVEVTNESTSNPILIYQKITRAPPPAVRAPRRPTITVRVSRTKREVWDNVIPKWIQDKPQEKSTDKVQDIKPKKTQTPSHENLSEKLKENLLSKPPIPEPIPETEQPKYIPLARRISVLSEKRAKEAPPVIIAKSRKEVWDLDPPPNSSFKLAESLPRQVESVSKLAQSSVKPAVVSDTVAISLHNPIESHPESLIHSKSSEEPNDNTANQSAQNNLEGFSKDNHEIKDLTQINHLVSSDIYSDSAVKRKSVQVLIPNERKLEVWDNILPKEEEIEEKEFQSPYLEDEEKEVDLFRVENISKPKIAYEPRSSYTFLQRAFFLYMNTFMKDCARHDLSLSQYPTIENEDNSAKIGPELLKNWRSEQNKYPSNPSFLSVLIKTNGIPWLIAGIPYFVESIARLGQAYVLRLLLDVLKSQENLQTQGGILGTNTSLLQRGSIWAAILSGLMIIKYSLSQYKVFTTSRIGMQLRVSIISAIFEKSLKVSSNIYSHGKITSLITSDLQIFENAAQYFHFLWIGPLEIAIVTFLLVEQLALIPALISMGFLLFLVLIQIIITISLQSIRKDISIHRDERIENLSSMISSIFSVKLLAWEDAFIKKIEDIRQLEYGSIKKLNFRTSICESIFFASSAAIPIVAFSFFQGDFTPSIVFSTCFYFYIVRQTMMNCFLKAIRFTIDFRSTLKKLQALFEAPEVQLMNDTSLEEFKDSSILAVMKDASFSWGREKNADGKFIEVQCLKKISLTLRKGELTGICGPLGSGKTSLLRAIIGEIECVGGTMGSIAESMAFVSQTPWIISGTYRDNITFGKPFRKQWFDEVVKACGLDVDFSVLPDKENSKIDERGLNLSGGMKVRISLARAAYSNADLYLLDDPLSIIDPNVSMQVFQNCIKTVLKKKTVLLVSHSISYIQQCDQVILLENGHMLASGTYQQVRKCSESSFTAALNQQPIFTAVPTVEKENLDRHLQRLSYAKKRSIHASTVEDDHASTHQSSLGSSEIGINSFEYLRISASSAVVFSIACCFLISQSFYLMSDYWLAHWTTFDSTNSSNYLTIYIMFGCITFLFSIIRAVSYFFCALLSSEAVFQQMLYCVFHSHSYFIQKTPFGRIVNRFAKDLADTDESYPSVSFDYFQKLLMVNGTLMIIFIAVPWTLLFFPFAIFTYVIYQRTYHNAIRRMKRLEAIVRSPIYTSIVAALEGKATIKAFKAEERVHDKFCLIQNDHTRVYFAFMNASRWFGIKADGILCSFFVLIVFSSVVLQKLLNLQSAHLGLMMFYLLLLVDFIPDYVKRYGEVENLLTAATRTVEFALDLPQESIDGDRPDDSWPSKGEVSISNLSLRYPDTDSDTLSNITANIPSGQKTCIVGRTGAGKTSMIHSIFRLYEPTPESIYIDDVSIMGLNLFYLRSRLAIIPQEPVCFQGTIRFNLDPYSDYPDDKIWAALELVHLKTKIGNSKLGLEYPILENGENLSVGEKQLLSIARAILRQPKVLILDEATSSIDIDSDKIFKEVIRNLHGVTIICVAHTLSSVVDYDHILVLNRGILVENGHPAQLLEKDPTESGSWLSRMVNMLSPEESAAIKRKLGIYK